MPRGPTLIHGIRRKLGQRAQMGEGHHALHAHARTAGVGPRTAEALMPCGLRGAPRRLERALGSCARIVRPGVLLTVRRQQQHRAERKSLYYDKPI